MSAVYRLPQPQAYTSEKLFDYFYYVPMWGDHQRGFVFEISTSGITRLRKYERLSELFGNSMIPIPFDPITAISLGLVTPEEINLPEGLRAAFNLLK